jgi:uncharacterized protein YkwD
MGLLLALAACAGPQTGSEPRWGIYTRLEQPGTALDEASALGLVNAWRMRNGVPPLVWDPALAALGRDNAARAAAEDRSTFGEVPNLVALGGSGASVKLSAGYLTLAEAFSGWRDMPAQNRAMLDPQARRLGIAAVRAPQAKYRVYWALATSPAAP